MSLERHAAVGPAEPTESTETVQPIGPYYLRAAQAFDAEMGVENDWQHGAAGDFGTVLFGTQPEPVALKVFPQLGLYNRSAVRYESWILGSLCTNDPDLRPLGVPEAIRDGDFSTPPYLAMQRLPGRTLTLDEIAALPAERRRELGSRAGAFAAWMSVKLSLEDYDALQQTSTFEVFDRESLIGEYLGPKHSALFEALGCLTLQLTLAETWHRYLRLRMDGKMEPTIVGHDDLHRGNLLFEEENEELCFRSVIDFGLTKPVTPERGLRHMHGMGGDVSRAAVKSYEAATGQRLSYELLDFWAVAQYVTLAAVRVQRESNWRDPRRLVEVGVVLQRLCPDRDWSELLEPQLARTFPKQLSSYLPGDL